MADEKLTAATRLEKLLDNIAGGDNEVTPATRLEKFLSYIADAMEGGGGSGGGCKCVNIDITNSKRHDGTIFAYVNGEWTDTGYSATRSLDYSGDLITKGPLFLTSNFLGTLATYGDTVLLTIELESDSSQTAPNRKGFYVLEDNVTLQTVIYGEDTLLIIPEGANIVYNSGLG